MHPYREISDKTARRIDRTMLEMAGLATLKELEVKFMQDGGGILPADFLCWNNWSLDWQQLTNCGTNSEYEEPCERVMEAFGQVVGHHPVIAANHFPTTVERVLRLSDFQSYSSFRENPLFKEVYRHVDSHFQICHTACELKDSRILLMWNRRGLDFSGQDQEIFHYMSQRLGVLAKRIEERQYLDGAWKTLCGFIDSRMLAGTVESLGERDGKLVSELLRKRSRKYIAHALHVRRDTVDKRLGAIRERLGLENHHQLLSALAELRNPAAD